MQAGDRAPASERNGSTNRGRTRGPSSQPSGRSSTSCGVPKAAMAEPDITLRTCCRDCARDTTKIGHFYMVWDHVWAASGLGPEDGELCLDCLQRRLGRELALGDFKSTTATSDYSWGGGLMLPRVWRDRWPPPQKDLPYNTSRPSRRHDGRRSPWPWLRAAGRGPRRRRWRGRFWRSYG
jgi:hypothetical protein